MTGGRLVKHARYYGLRPAAISRRLFGSMVRRIDAEQGEIGAWLSQRRLPKKKTALRRIKTRLLGVECLETDSQNGNPGLNLGNGQATKAASSFATMEPFMPTNRIVAKAVPEMTLTPDCIRCDQNTCQNLDQALRWEWLETNGLGGFSSSTITGLNARRYHGLLTAATKPPVGRVLLLSKLEETLVIDGKRFDLGVNRYPGTIYPRGHEHLVEFRMDPFPVFVYRAGGVELEKRVFMVQGENTTVVEYAIRQSGAEPVSKCALELRPLVAFRDYHGTTHENGALNPTVTIEPGLATIHPYADLPFLHFAHDADTVESTGAWYRNFEYPIEQERGLDYQEDLFNPFVARFDLSVRNTATVIASTERHHASEAVAFRKDEIRRRKTLRASAPCDDPLVQALTVAADQYIVKRGDLKTVIAGYHWFSDWGRDTMIALPGLTLVTGRPEVAESILLAFADSVDQGMLPNRFPDAGETPEYNTVDATLWFFEAVRAFLAYTGDAAFVRDKLYPKLKEIIEWHMRGTRYGIRADSDGLLNCGVPGVQLTWMDSKIGDWVVTPRYGKPVEIQALWYNALRVMDSLAAEFDPAMQASYATAANQAKESFNAKFWNEAQGCLYDVVNGDGSDGSIRPNQIFAVSLPHTMLAEDRARRVVEVVERDLFVPCGLRSLSPRDQSYRPHYQGGVWERDSAYHQGTVWPWLMGPFITAYVKVNGRSDAARQRAATWLAGFLEQVNTTGLGQIPEIADAELPHTPRGCMAQAWSVAELLRAAVEDVFETRAAAKQAAAE
jgi:predicted glycogen debranching enzyme